jgi:hypothetical protein
MKFEKLEHFLEGNFVALFSLVERNCHPIYVSLFSLQRTDGFRRIFRLLHAHGQRPASFDKQVTIHADTLAVSRRTQLVRVPETSIDQLDSVT